MGMRARGWRMQHGIGSIGLSVALEAGLVFIGLMVLCCSINLVTGFL